MITASSDCPLVWFKGKFLPPDQALVSIMSPTAQFGLNVFEGVRGYANNSEEIFLFRLQEHLIRLFQSCRLIGIDPPYTLEEIKAAILQIIRHNKMHNDLALRVTCFVDGFGSWSSINPVELLIAPIYKPRIRLQTTSCNTASISTWRRIDDSDLPPRVKAGANYINGRYAHLEALAQGASLPILLNSAGKVAEGAGACLMIVRNGRLITPPTSASILESLTRDTLLALASEAGLQTFEREIDRTELYIADEVFLCGSSAEVTPLTQIDRFIISNGQPGPITCRLSNLYFSVTDGTSQLHSDWRTPVWQGFSL